MPRNYRHIQQYEQEMIELKEKGWTVKAIGEKYGLSYEEAHGFFKRYNRKQKKLAEGIEINGDMEPVLCRPADLLEPHQGEGG